MKFKPIWKSDYFNFGALYECPVCHKSISTPHDGTPNFCCECGIAFEWESEKEKRQSFAKQILWFWKMIFQARILMFV